MAYTSEEGALADRESSYARFVPSGNHIRGIVQLGTIGAQNVVQLSFASFCSPSAL